MRMLAIPALLILAGCYTTPVVMVNDKGETRQCGPYKSNDFAAEGAAMQERQCIEDYKEQGYRRK